MRCRGYSLGNLLGLDRSVSTTLEEHVSIHDDETGQPNDHQGNHTIVPNWGIIPFLPSQVQQVHLPHGTRRVENQEGIVT